MNISVRDRKIWNRKLSSTYIQSKTAYKIGWGSSWWRSVHGLLKPERQAVRKGHHVWFSFRPWHHAQSGYKIVTVYHDRFDSREPTQEELQAIMMELEEDQNGHYYGA